MNEEEVVAMTWLIEGTQAENADGEPGTAVQIVDEDTGAAMATFIPHKNITLAVVTVLKMAEDFGDILNDLTGKQLFEEE